MPQPHEGTIRNGRTSTDPLRSMLVQSDRIKSQYPDQKRDFGTYPQELCQGRRTRIRAMCPQVFVDTSGIVPVKSNAVEFVRVIFWFCNVDELKAEEKWVFRVWRSLVARMSEKVRC